jgi:hypothetical protein
MDFVGASSITSVGGHRLADQQSQGHADKQRQQIGHAAWPGDDAKQRVCTLHGVRQSGDEKHVAALQPGLRPCG